MSGEDTYLDLKAHVPDVYMEVTLPSEQKTQQFTEDADHYLDIRDPKAAASASSATSPLNRGKSVINRGLAEPDEEEDMYLAVADVKIKGKSSGAAAKMSAGTLKREKGNRNIEEHNRLAKWLSLPTDVLNRETAAATMAGQTEGTFIFRRGSEANTYAITVVVQGQLKNYKVQREEVLDGTEYLVARDDRLTGGRKKYLSIYKLLEDKEIRAVWGLLYMCQVFDEKATNHYRCREESYPESKITRTFVPDGLVPWDRPYDAYKPAIWVDATIPNADPDMALEPPAPGAKRASVSSKFKFNKLDGKVDRRSLFTEYTISLGGLPINPRGRTGVIGRGALPRWGPNLCSTIIVTRMMKQLTSDKPMMRRGKPVIEFLAVEEPLSGSISFPVVPWVPGEQIPEAFEKIFTSDDSIKRNFSGGDKERKAFKKGMQAMFKKPAKLYSGYVDDPRNTDNSWVETVVSHVHDPTGEFFDYFLFADESDNRMWMPADKRVQLQAEHSEYLRQIADLLKASYI